MEKHFKAFFEVIAELGHRKIAFDSKLGFERESLRVKNSRISPNSHPKALGSSNCNRYITIDFSEAQLELITPPNTGAFESLEMLDNIHHFVINNIGDETLWPLSMPPSFKSEDEIPVGIFGPSNQGRFKHIYRLGLANRYGKSMQTISGFHFNFSLPEEIWNPSIIGSDINPKEFRSLIYFNILRNIYQMNWFLVYLFGSSPIIDKKMIKNKNDDFIELSNDSALLPYSTSLRMSEYGYCNSDRKNIYVSVNSLEEYAADLRSATESIEPRYLKYQKQANSQLNSNILQIEAEYYAVARAKSNLRKFERPSTVLMNEGVSFIEVRSIDINPFERSGISHDDILFLEMFMIFCSAEQCEMFDQKTIEIINKNDETIAKYGRKPKISLVRNRKNILMTDWANEILDRMTPIAEKLDSDESEYLRVIDSMRLKINDTAMTQSERLIEKVKEVNNDQTQLGDILGHEYKKEFMGININENAFWSILEEESKLSLNQQKDLEKKTMDSKLSFDNYKKKYYRS